MNISKQIFVLSFMTFGLLSCNKKTIEPVEPIVKTQAPNASKPIKYLALGDSYTIGESVNFNERYPIQLSNRLKNHDVEFDTTLIIAQTGWRTDNLISAINQANLTDTFDLVSLLIGVNNQYQNRPIAQYETEFLDLINQAINLVGGDTSKVFVLSIPDYGFTPFGKNNQSNISSEIDVYNAINKKITEDLGITWFDITPISRKGLDQPILVAADGLHPSGNMYRLWVDLIFENVKFKLE